MMRTKEITKGKVTKGKKRGLAGPHSSSVDATSIGMGGKKRGFRPAYLLALGTQRLRLRLSLFFPLLALPELSRSRLASSVPLFLK